MATDTKGPLLLASRFGALADLCMVSPRADRP